MTHLYAPNDTSRIANISHGEYRASFLALAVPSSGCYSLPRMHSTSRAGHGRRTAGGPGGATTIRRARASSRPADAATRRPHAARVALHSLVAVGLVATVSLAPLATASAPYAVDTTDGTGAGTTIGGGAASLAGATQTVSVDPAAALPASVPSETYVATTGTETLVEGGTNHDWARLVLIEGGWPVTEENVNFMVRWMRQENGVDNWWNRNNPLNNGQGSGGGSGLGSYVDLTDAAYYAAENLAMRSFYSDIVAGLEAGTSADATAAALWASPWATSHYGYGTHWSTSPAPEIEAPPEAWGR